METKKEIRRSSLKKRMELSSDVRQRYSLDITERVVNHPFFRYAETVCCYVTFREEVDTTGCIQAAWDCGKRVMVPRVCSEQQMEFYEIRSMDELTSGYQGILEPVVDPVRVFHASNCERALMLVPGVSFDRNGNRIGYGKGFYDTYLKKYPHIPKMGLAFHCQCVPQIPAESHDICMDAVITERGDFKKG